MHAIVNHLPLQEGTDWSALAAKIDRFEKAVAQDHPQLRGVCLVRVDDTHGILLVYFDTREALDDFSRNVAGPWFAENVRQYLSGSVSRSVGEIVAGSIPAA